MSIIDYFLSRLHHRVEIHNDFRFFTDRYYYYDRYVVNDSLESLI